MKEETFMKMVSVLLVSCTLAFMPGDYAMAQVAGSTRLGVSVEEVKIVASGWSSKKQILGKTVFNENNEKVGKIDDLIVAPTGELSFVIIGAGGFAGVGRHDVAIPVALAWLFTFLLGPIVSALERAGLGRMRAGKAIAVTLVVGLVFSVLGGAGWVIVQQVTALGSELPQYRGNIMRKVAEFRGSGRGGVLAEVQSTAKEVMGELQKEATPKGESKPLPVVVKPETSGIWQLPRILQALSAAGFVIVLVIFMLLERHEIRNRFIRLTGEGRLANVTRALDEANDRITRYLVVQTMINVTYGVAVSTGLFVIGVPYAVMWGFLAFLLRFLPYVGPPMAAAGPIVLSLAVFDGWHRPLATVALFFVVELATYMIVEPLLYGQTIGVSSAALLVAVAFWTWLWGPIGLVLGTPLTVCLVVLGKHIPALGFITV